MAPTGSVSPSRAMVSRHCAHWPRASMPTGATPAPPLFGPVGVHIPTGARVVFLPSVPFPLPRPAHAALWTNSRSTFPKRCRRPRPAAAASG
ncbi:hypothetical protein BU14_0120s0024 [Porphyra umbilicalis]|uniref:Uncharacterized protein n=1 Tax=Porphyra umbilicalis TaxID=2786 RepID=A0A1X6PB74_PORUM|nr:hypothetical protein BU14_0120s0024 [Porphyra umbilicalis]|eukprot:OSX78141.1 hypothetical protein BU14_0120s0024 [Porphyra umbilicalis]